MLFSLTVGKVDAGVAVLLTDDKRLIEFPSILLPSSITSGSIVDITVAQNPTREAESQKSFFRLQDDILQTYGLETPATPVLRCRNATQTSLVLEWDALNLATATLRSLSLYRNGAKAGVIPRYGRDGEEVLATKVSGLAVDTQYTFQLRLKTSAGQYISQELVCRTQKMTDLTGITVTPGPLPPPLRASLATAVERIGAKLVEGVRIDTTHFVCTEGRGREWEKAGEMNIPVVRPEWVEGCEREGRIVGVRAYYLGADPRLRQVGQPASNPIPIRDKAADAQPSKTVESNDSSVESEHPAARSRDSNVESSPRPPLPEKDDPQQPANTAPNEDSTPPSPSRSPEEDPDKTVAAEDATATAEKSESDGEGFSEVQL